MNICFRRKRHISVYVEISQNLINQSQRRIAQTKVFPPVFTHFTSYGFTGFRTEKTIYLRSRRYFKHFEK